MAKLLALAALWLLAGLLVARGCALGQRLEPHRPAHRPTSPWSPIVPTQTTAVYLHDLSQATFQAQRALNAADNTIHLAAMGAISRSEAQAQCAREFERIQAALDVMQAHAATWTLPPATYPGPIDQDVRDAYELTEQTERLGQLPSPRRT